MKKGELTSLQGIYFGLGAYFLWGFLPIYWKLLQDFSAGIILANRVIWSCFFVGGLLWYKDQLKTTARLFADKKKIMLVSASSLIISLNWFTYIWAVNAGFVIQASIGYYINPLMVVLMGTLIFKEKMERVEKIALFFAFSGVVIITFEYGSIPWVSLILATTFSVYGLCKRVVQVDSIAALGIETLMITPIAVIYLIYATRSNTFDPSQVSLSSWLLLMGAGFVTATPLLWFAIAAKTIPFSVLGFIQYLSPTISLLLGVFLFKEPFTGYHLISFSLIWTGILMFTYTRTKRIRQQRKILKNNHLKKGVEK
ncbi:EamA family transporter RarD [Tindallia californiensis]|uniref:Chloramphenicol-sensitive protein RarD n=1 Tax=Tindallia californiensis TaxID=159292 RepID=A0A1H3K8A9_9FIRM|nr:EamA family transporter RarD [Tindallia californiensis]SDY48015.1 chloramphenicol-sensitive protein RarD [Tindallia californiensis]